MATNTQVASVILLLGALICGFVAMSTVYWAGDVGSQRGKSVGLWQACEYVEGRTMECFRVLGLKFYETETEKLDWFKAVQGIYTLSLLCLIVSLVCSWSGVCVRTASYSLTRAAMFLSLASVVFCTIALIIFGARTLDEIRFYITSAGQPMWSFYMAMVCGILQLFALPCLLITQNQIMENNLEKRGPLLVSRMTLHTRSMHSMSGI
ncbi:unnamed protein product [Owenia fusiformis]|uniref:Uncharacterized protein n=1 Tax=Owenia fusiformis TaxID=6347 RepID=A0A8J1UX15_OWEFU|nr:unnamed protein product [Owenia fusiformis]